ncbi:MAG: cytochrome c biogenesis protein CcdA [Clostridia bacterium]|nr:cytochrome c biogenesis protein CcdA [Clostridia bacterium]NCC69246.1 cytochrome c biogenesis protein CcdA [Clostridia bacterium]
MQYLVSFLEGIITFISPCLLPMLPVYVSYFAGGGEDAGVSKTLKNASGFVLGFTIIFTLLGALAGTLGSFLSEHRTTVNVVSGLIVIFFGLTFVGLIKLNIFRGANRARNVSELGFFSSVLFGIVFSIGWTPCVGAFLGSALMLASQQAHMVKGIIMLLLYSLGLGMPFILSAVLIGKLKSAFDFIKRNYRIINIIAGSFLIITGVAMMTGTFGNLISLLDF